MSTSASPHPNGQNHDREDGQISDGGHQGNDEASSADHEHHELDSDSDDAMDTTPDMTPIPGTAEGQAAEDNHEATVHDPTNPVDAPPFATIPPPVLVSATSPGSHHSTLPPNSNRGTPVPPSPHPDAAPPNPPDRSEDEDDSDTEDEDDDYIWQPIVEDTTPPDEHELREIERLGERSALERGHWEKQTFTALEDPEYTSSDSGHIDWPIEHFNGTAENPNRELLMRSPMVRIGNHEWQIKLYPRGNDSDYLSVYIECTTLSSSDAHNESGSESGSSSTLPDTPNEGPFVHHPITALPGTPPIEAGTAVPAQVSVIVYNPSNPTAWQFHCARHRFTKNSPDWGWTRFCGPRRELGMRTRTRQAPLLQKDRLALRAMIRVVDDQTGVLWEHGPGTSGSSGGADTHHDEEDVRDEPVWDSVKMTGLRGLTAEPGGDPTGWDRPRRGVIYGGNLVAAVSSWMLFKPFRQLLYSIPVPNPVGNAPARCMPMVVALQKIVISLRTPKLGAWPVSLEPLQDAWAWYGMDECIEKWDVVEVWEMIRLKLIEEFSLIDPQAPDKVANLIGDWAQMKPTTTPKSLRVSIRGRTSIQNALNKTLRKLPEGIVKPGLLAIELRRQEYDEKKRSWVRVTDRVKIDEHISFGGTGYTLYGLIVHKGGLQSGNYYPVLRPEGPGTKWYAFFDEREHSKVTCLTQRQAIEAHEGWKSSDKRGEADPVAYIALYIHDDICAAAFDSKIEPAWNIPSWIIEEIDRSQRPWSFDEDVAMSDPAHTGLPPPMPPANGIKLKAKEPGEDTIVDFKIISSRAFCDHSGPGIIDVFDPKWTPGSNEHVYKLSVKSTATLKDIRKAIARIVKGISDPEQCKLWMLDSYLGTELRPTLLLRGNPEISGGPMAVMDWTAAKLQTQSSERTIWLHVVDSPQDPESSNSATPSKNTISQRTDRVTEPTASQNGADDGSTIPNEDTVMSDAPSENDNEVVPPIVEAPPDAIETLIQLGVNGDLETWTTPPPFPPGTSAPPPPIPQSVRTLMAVSAVPPMPLAPPSSVDDVYFFLKVFDHDSQQLRCHGSYIAKKQWRADVTILKILGLPDKSAVKFYEEEDLGTATPIHAKRHTFSQAAIHGNSIVIAHPNPPDDVQKRALAERGAFHEPEAYLQAQVELRNFADMASGNFTFDYFSAEQYEGEVRFRIPHGLGKKTYFSGDIYEGSFVLGKRSGRGIMIYANGDRYDGEWLNDSKDGNGTFIESSTGNAYEGGWKNDRRFGEGVTKWKVAQEMERMCRVCWEEAADAAFYDCGHVVACLPCAKRMDNCPVCRRRVVNSMKLYYVS
ncbi:hypothetical protein P152DRAFT_457525 [Eremomyces bilateralis CBS 781.70]|uniref:RING-type domain-containing protein n=1 Tax=Eremomyces bilateralis CBS 781.70 TaxID=1392243 RepID=A0A6G1G4Z3_9PEZI|nr:uncharacterized protein P152DRAFT_457525 [Eremomyces bilateralis CBS 781.70]KAF1813165.1 hypothetical protein P152DRAFT_457525 [Eremomyces bilateralis CBS 781.70]